MFIFQYVVYRILLLYMYRYRTRNCYWICNKWDLIFPDANQAVMSASVTTSKHIYSEIALILIHLDINVGIDPYRN